MRTTARTTYASSVASESSSACRFDNAVGRHVQCNRRTTRPFETSASQMMEEVKNGQGDHDEVDSDIVASQTVQQVEV